MLTTTLMDAEQAADLLRRAEQLDFSSGKDSATGTAKGVKENLQAVRSGVDYETLATEVTALLSADARLEDAVFPLKFSRPVVNRYDVGGAYGLHVDTALVDGPSGPMRRDLSYTLFLTPPDQYAGGELQISGEDAAASYRLPPGQLVVYPTHALHQVTPVTSGSRISVVGWIESWIADPHYRRLMSRLRSVQGAMASEGMSSMSRLIMQETVQGLLRYGAR